MNLLIGTDLKVSAVTETSINQTLKILLMPVAQLEKKSLLSKVKKTSTTVAQKDKRLIGMGLPPSAVRPQRIKSSLTTEVDKPIPLMLAVKQKRMTFTTTDALSSRGLAIPSPAPSTGRAVVAIPVMLRMMAPM